jgi:hypothetical protein
VPDPRSAKGKQYAIEELLMSGIGMFLFKEGSRNPFNNHRTDGHTIKCSVRDFRIRIR